MSALKYKLYAYMLLFKLENNLTGRFLNGFDSNLKIS